MKMITGSQMRHTSSNVLSGPLYTFHAIHDEDDAVHSGQRAVCVFSEILVTGRVQEVDEASW